MREDWEVKKLGEICNVIAGQSPESKFYNDVGEGLPFYQGKKEFTEKFIGFPKIWTTKITKEANEGDLLMSVRAPVGPINVATQKICIGRGLAAIRASNKVDKDFLFYGLLSKQSEINGKDGAVFSSINKDAISAIEFAFPPLPEQKRIVAILDEAFKGIDTAIANTEKNLKNARGLFESYLNSVFTEKGEDWVEKKLGDVCIVERGSSPRPIKKYLTNDPSGVNWVKIGDTKNVNKYIFSTKEKITPEGAEKSRFVDEGDFILSNSMSFGRPFIMKTSGYIHDGWFVLRLKEEIDRDYFYNLLSSTRVQKQFSQLSSGAIVKNINSDLTKSAVLPIPPLIKQKNIVEKLDALSIETKRLEAIYQQKLNDLVELKQSILQKAFAGELTSDTAKIMEEAVA